MTQKKNSTRGFGAAPPEKRKEIAARGGAAVPSNKRSFSKDKALASAAGAKGGRGSHGGGRKPGSLEVHQRDSARTRRKVTISSRPEDQKGRR